MAIVDKRRQKANSSEVMNIIGDVRDKHVILLDDMVDTGGSLCHAAEALVTIGGARDVVAAASHGVLSGPAIQRIEDSCIKELFFLNTIPASEDALKCSKIKYVNVADVFAEAIRRIFNETSVSPLFQYKQLSAAPKAFRPFCLLRRQFSPPEGKPVERRRNSNQYQPKRGTAMQYPLLGVPRFF